MDELNDYRARYVGKNDPLSWHNYAVLRELLITMQKLEDLERRIDSSHPPDELIGQSWAFSLSLEVSEKLHELKSFMLKSILNKN